MANFFTNSTIKNKDTRSLYWVFNLKFDKVKSKTYEEINNMDSEKNDAYLQTYIKSIKDSKRGILR